MQGLGRPVQNHSARSTRRPTRLELHHLPNRKSELILAHALSGNNPEPWKSTGGNPDTGGYLSITDAVNGQNSTIIFPDFDGGLIVKAFTFSADLRVGNAIGNAGRPADGFSISYARASDPVIASGGDIGSFAVPGGPENGTSTGIAISFDTWAGNTLPDGPDLEGIIVRVDNKTIFTKAMVSRNGSCTDINSLQTGPWDGQDTGDPSGLCWARLEVELSEAAQLTVKWKGATLMDHVQTQFFPSAGQLVLAGRTGGANENNHVDNITITTVPAEKALVTGIFGNATGVTVNLEDVGASVVDANTLVVKLDDTAVTGQVGKSGKTTTFTYRALPPFASGSNHKVDVSFKDTRGVAVASSATFGVGAYTLLAPELAAAAGSVDTSKAGFRIGPYETEENQPNSLAWTEDQLLGKHGANLADLSGADAGGYYDRETVVNFDIGGGIGNFGGDEQFPGLPGTGTLDNGTGNSAMEILTYLEFNSAGVYQMGVNSDDGFRVSVSHNPKDRLGVVLGQFDGGRGAADTLFDFVVQRPGTYAVRLIWENGGGGANLEWFSVLAGRKILINDATEADAIKAYRSGPQPPYAEVVTPAPNATGVSPIVGTAVVELVDGATQVANGSITATLDGQVVTPVVSAAGAGRTRVSIPLGELLPSGSRHTVAVAYQDNASPAAQLGGSWSFTAASYAEVPADVATALGSGDGSKPGFKVRTYQIDQIGGVSLANLNSVAEQALVGLAGPNVADLSGAGTDGTFAVSGVINFNRDAPADAGNFNATNGYEDQQFPGLPGTGTEAHNLESFVEEIITYVEFPRPGIYTLGVNSDDGFKMSPTDQAPANNGALVVGSPALVAGAYLAVSGGRDGGGIARAITGPISGKLVYVDPPLADATIKNADAVRGNIALIDRGAVTFSQKLGNALAAGAVAVVIANNRAPDHADGILPIVMGGSAVDIPAVMITRPDGDKIKQGLPDMMVSITPDTSFGGQFNGGRGSADTVFSILIPKAGVYPMRTEFQQGGGGANLEIFTVEPDGTKILLNDRANSKALKSYRARSAATPPPTISIRVEGSDAVITFTGMLQAADNVKGPYTDAVNATSPRRLALTANAKKFWRARKP
jgi:hypothetical protein